MLEEYVADVPLVNIRSHVHFARRSQGSVVSSIDHVSRDATL